MIKRKKIIDVMEDWLEQYQLYVSKSTYVKYKQLMENYIKRYFYNVRCEDINEDMILNYRQWLCSGKVKLSQGNKRTIIMILNKILGYALKNNDIKSYIVIKPCLSKEKTFVSVLSNNEQKLLENYIINHKNLYTAAILTALYSGIRIGELCALRWSDVDFNDKSITITRTVQRLAVSNNNSKTQVIISTPKSTSSYRKIPLPQCIIVQFKELYCEENNDTYIFSGKNVPLEPRTLQHAYKRILKECNISYLNFHCLRHTFATRCIHIGWDVKTLSEILGHSDVKITMEYYVHSSFEHKKKQMNKLKLMS